MTSPSGDIGELQTEDTSFFALENGNNLKLNIPNLFDNFSIFLIDARVDVLSGGGYSSNCMVLDLSSRDMTDERTTLSAVRTLVQASPNALLDSVVYKNVKIPDDNHSIWTNRADTPGSAVYGDFTAIVPDTTKGWVVMLSGNPQNGGQIAWESGLSAFQGNPWDVEVWYPNASARWLTSNFTLTAGDSPVFNNWNFSTAAAFNNLTVGVRDTNMRRGQLQKFNNPGLGIVRNHIRFSPSSTSPATNAFGTSALSGLVAIATYDRNGSSNIGLPYGAGMPVGIDDYGSIFSLSGTENKFTVRIPSPSFNPHATSVSTSQNITAFNSVGSLDMPAPIIADDGRFEVLRIGFKRRLQDVVLYSKPSELNPYETHGVIHTNLATNTKPTLGVRVGLAYRGKMPFAIKNLAVNAISGVGEPLI